MKKLGEKVEKSETKMWLAGVAKNNIKGGNGSVGNLLVRYMSRTRAVNVRKINPKVPIPEAHSIASSLYDVIKQHGPLTVPNTWIHAQVLFLSPLLFFFY